MYKSLKHDDHYLLALKKNFSNLSQLQLAYLPGGMIRLRTGPRACLTISFNSHLSFSPTSEMDLNIQNQNMRYKLSCLKEFSSECLLNMRYKLSWLKEFSSECLLNMRYKLSWLKEFSSECLLSCKWLSPSFSPGPGSSSHSVDILFHSRRHR